METLQKYRWPLAGLMIVLLLGGLVFAGQSQIEHWIAANEQAFTAWLQPERFEKQQWLLMPAAFAGGLIASLSPCILALLPVNLSYIGTRKAKSKWEALINASAFVAGVVLVLSLFGLVGSFAGLIIIDYRGYVHLLVGLLSIALGIGLMGVFKMKVPALVTHMPAGMGPFLIGAAFALVTSPCGSPVLLAILTMAGTSGNLLTSVLAMACYAFGYTIIIFISSLMGGFAKQVGRLQQYAPQISQLGGLLLIIAGLYYGLSGVQWLIQAFS